MTGHRLSALLRPRRIAVLGASDRSYFSRNVVDNLRRFGHGEHVHLVNPRSRAAHGTPTVPTIADIGESVDLVFSMLPQTMTLDGLTEAAAHGVRNAVVITAGYAEAGVVGRRAQEELVTRAIELDMMVLGPNMLGFANFVDRIPVTAIPKLPDRAGPVALLSQSGASSSAMMEFAETAGAQLSYLVTLGNEAMVTTGDLLDYLVDDEATTVIAMFVETIRDPDAFRSAAARASAAGKPVIMLKAGRSALGARSAAAHTGAVAGDDAVTGAVLDDLGVIRVRTIEDMLVTAGAAARFPRLRAPGVGVVSVSGGACDVVADLAHDAGLALPELGPQTIERLAAVLPDYATVHNPLDVTGAAVLDPTIFTRAITAVAAEPAVGAVLVVSKVPWESSDLPFAAQPIINAIGAGAASADAPVLFVNQVMQPITAATREVLARGGVPHAICGISTAVTAMAALGRWSARRAVNGSTDIEAAAGAGAWAARQVPPDERSGTWSEARARDLLAAADVPVVPARCVRTAADAVAAARDFGGPVSCKIAADDLVHKSDVGGVLLDVSGDDAVAAAFQSVWLAGARAVGEDRLTGVLVSPMRPRGIELLAGVTRDEQWGLLLAVGLGGVFVEIVDDCALAPLPVDAARVAEMLRSLRAHAMLDGARGLPATDLGAVGAAVARLGDLALGLGDDLQVLEVNPLWVLGSDVEALDATLVWREDHSAQNAPTGKGGLPCRQQ